VCGLVIHLLVVVAVTCTLFHAFCGVFLVGFVCMVCICGCSGVQI